MVFHDELLQSLLLKQLVNKIVKKSDAIDKIVQICKFCESYYLKKKSCLQKNNMTKS